MQPIKTKMLKPTLGALVLAGLAFANRPAAAAVYDLRAASTTVTMSDGAEITMWGFGLLADPAVSIPGPALEVPPGDTTLTINLTNDLPVPVSIVIPALPAPLSPLWNDGTSGPRANLQQRAVSFTTITPPGQTMVYEWTNVQPGTYLYHSGTHPAVQVPMGLYGSMVCSDAANMAYGEGYDAEALLLYSEIDPSLNAAVASGAYGTPAYPTTIDYRARYFLVNGQETSSAPQLQAYVGQTLLVRMINAGLRTTVPTLTAGSMKLLAEDGNAAPWALDRYSALLPAGKTRDGLMALSAEGSTVLFDRRGAGQFARLAITTPQDAPIAAADSYSVDEDASLDTAAAALPGVLDNDTGTGLTAILDSPTSAGTLALQPDGSFTYAPALNFNGVDTFTYHAYDGVLGSNVVAVSITVNPTNDPPSASDDAYEVFDGDILTVAAPGVLGNDSDIDGDTLQANLVDLPTGGALNLGADGSLEYTPDPGTTQDSFTYEASDGLAPSNLATVTISVVQAVNQAPIADDDYAATKRNVSVLIDVVANDSDPDGSIDPASVNVVTQPTKGGSVTSFGNGTLEYTPRNNFKGTDTFEYVVSDDLGAVSQPATVHVNVTK